MDLLVRKSTPSKTKELTGLAGLITLFFLTGHYEALRLTTDETRYRKTPQRRYEALLTGEGLNGKPTQRNTPEDTRGHSKRPEDTRGLYGRDQEKRGWKERTAGQR